MLNNWNEVKYLESSDENVFKYVFTKSNAAAEAVLYKYPTFEDRTVICCSTQSGCPIGCRFCGAGDDFIRSLTADEIVSQSKYLFEHKGIDTNKIKALQIMFMSMGEPMLNFKELDIAIRELHGMYPVAALLISTSGPRVDYEPVIKLSKEVSKVGLQFSVHESTDESRNALIPFKAKLSLKEIAETGQRWYEQVGRKPFFNYCAHDKNSSPIDADRILELFDPKVWEATISVVCERDETMAAANDRQRDLAATFMALLRQRGFSTRMFDPAGQDDIGGGCGQLHFWQTFVKNNPHLAKPSIGRHLPILHMPK